MRDIYYNDPWLLDVFRFDQRRRRPHNPLTALSMDVAEAISHLTSLGLHVSQHVPGGMTDRDPSDGLTIARAVVPVGEVDTLEDVCHIFPLRSRWCYRNWNGIGGRAPDDVQIENLSLDQAVECAESFYFGSPLVIDGWVFPMH